MQLRCPLRSVCLVGLVHLFRHKKKPTFCLRLKWSFTKPHSAPLKGQITLKIKNTYLSSYLSYNLSLRIVLVRVAGFWRHPLYLGCNRARRHSACGAQSAKKNTFEKTNSPAMSLSRNPDLVTQDNPQTLL